MEAPFQILERTCRRRARRKRGKKQMLRNGPFESPFQNLGVVRKITKSVRKRIRISNQCLNSFVQGLYEETLNLNEEREIVRYRECDTNLVEQTIDLCDGDSVLDSSSSNGVIVPSLKDKEDAAVVIDVSNDISKQKEVIDLTKTDNPTSIDCQTVTSFQPIVIDISDDVAKEVNPKSDNDEVFVIGTFTRTSGYHKKKSTLMPLFSRCNNFSSLVTCSKKLKRKYIQKHSVFGAIENKKIDQCKQVCLQPQQNLAKIGENVYINSPVTLPSNGLRPIIIDGSNVAFVHSTCNFSCKRLEICINYFKEKGHKVTAFVPQFRLNNHRNDNPELLRSLEKKGDVVFTPSKRIDGRNIVPYDDRFIVQTAVLKGGIIVTRDNYNDLLHENPSWAETIKYRTLAFTWVDDVLMFPKDPLGEYGPSLEEFLRFH